MKLYKQLTTSLLAASIFLAMSVTSLAFDVTDGAYTYEVKLENEEKKVVNTVAPGEEVYLSLYVYDTNNPTTSVTLPKHDASCIDFGYIIPIGGLDSNYLGVDGLELDGNGTTATYVEDDNSLYVLGSVSATAAALTFSNAEPVIRTKIKVTNAEIDNIVIDYFSDNLAVSDGKVGVCIPTTKPFTYSVKEKTVSDKPANGDEIGTTNGKKIYYANTVSGTFNKNTGFVVKYTGDDATYKGKYEGDCKDIKATLGDLLGGEIGEGGVTGNLHFGIVLKDTSLEAATIPGFQVETK